MGFYFRKSITVGPMRFNLSKKGLGVSAGIPGFRVGMGPRGNYIHMGRSGIYYRTALSPQATRRKQSFIPTRPPKEVITRGTHEPLQEIESASVLELSDSSSQDLLNEINEKQRRMRLVPFVVVGIVVLISAAILAEWAAWVWITFAILALPLTYLTYQRDLLAKSVVLFYEFDSGLSVAYNALHESAEEMAACAKIWHVEAKGRVHHQKYHAGAESLVRRNLTFIRKAQPPHLKTNIEAVAIGVGQQTLYFFPDRLLVFDGSGVGAMPYRALRGRAMQRQFVEDGEVPNDAKIVGRTWRYVNKKGGPDRRFRNNPELPICLYDELRLRSNTGLDELIQLSRCDVANNFARAIGNLASSLSAEQPRPAG